MTAPLFVGWLMLKYYYISWLLLYNIIEILLYDSSSVCWFPNWNYRNIEIFSFFVLKWRTNLLCLFPNFKKCRKLHFLEIAAPLCVGNNIWFAEHYNFLIRQLLCVLVSKLKYSDQRPPSRKYRSRWETQKKPQTYLENNKFYRRNYWPSKRMTASQYHTVSSQTYLKISNSIGGIIDPVSVKLLTQ